MSRFSTRFAVGLIVLVMLSATLQNASASNYSYHYSPSTSTVRTPSVTLQAGTSGTETVYSPGNYATVTYSSLAYPPVIAITLTNSQPGSTPSGLQQQISFNPSTYSSYETSDLGNIRFCADAACVTTLNAWLESCSPSCGPGATSAVSWVKLPSSIPASGTLQIYMTFLSSGAFDGNYWGEGPGLSATYGQYDNGANVFVVYNAGTSLFASSHTGTGGSGPSVTTSAPSPYSHAITGSVSGGTGTSTTWTTNGVTTTGLPSSYIAQTLVRLTGSAALTDLLTNVQSITTGQFYVFRFDTRGGQRDLIGGYASGATSTTVLSTSSTTSSTGVWYQLTAIDSGDQLSLYKATSAALGSYGTLEAGPIAGMGYTGGGIAVTTDGATSADYWTMIVVRAYPPNGVMPSVSFGSIQVRPEASVAITITNSQASPTPNPFQAKITFNPSAYSAYEASNLGNIRFCADSVCSSPLYAWLESCAASCIPSATSAVAWIKLTSVIGGGGGTLTIYMVFLPTSTNFDSGYWGEAPQLSATYGQYDNGANVFVVYNAGTSLFASSHMGTGGSGPSVTASAPAPYTHAITGSVTGGGANANSWTTNGETATALLSSYIAQVVIQMTGSGTALTDVLTNFQSITTGQFYVFRLDTRPGQSDIIGYYPSGGTTTTFLTASGVTSSAGTWYQMTVVNNNDALSLYRSTSFGLDAYGSLEAGPVTGMGYTGGGIAVTTDGVTSTDYWTMVIVRAFPPGNMMPSASFGSLTGNFILAISNGASSAWNVNLAVASSSNVNRLYNLTVWFYSPVSAQVRLGTGVSQLTTGPAVGLSGSGTLYIALYASSTSGGSSTVTLSLKVQSGSNGPYAQYTIVLTVN